jgi:hypothetical protein
MMMQNARITRGFLHFWCLKKDDAPPLALKKEKRDRMWREIKLRRPCTTLTTPNKMRWAS